MSRDFVSVQQVCDEFTLRHFAGETLVFVEEPDWRNFRMFWLDIALIDVLCVLGEETKQGRVNDGT
jgi:hypothetical protein